jgi:glutamine synthetase
MDSTKKKSRARKSGAPSRATSDAAPALAAAPPEPELWQRLEDEGVKWAKIGGFDIDGVLRGKYVSLAKLRSALSGGFGFCDVIFGWDVADALYSDAKLTGWHTGYPDAHAVLDPSTLRRIPWEPGVVAMLCDFRTGDGADHPACPRSLFKRIIARARELGFEARFGAEFEFFLFRETRETAAAKGYQNLTPLDPGMFGYSWLRTGQDSGLVREILDGMLAHGIDIEGFHTETGPGVYEAAIRYDDALVAADKAALFKTVLKQIVSRHGLSVTFMAKFNATLPGAGGHLHQSLWKGKTNVFTGNKRGVISPLLKSYIGGQVALMPELTALYSPTVNSYKRYVPGVWAPLSASWGVENRTCSIRVIDPQSAASARVEYRQTASDLNPYIAMATCLAAGLWGIETNADPGPEAQGDASGGPARLPTTLKEAIALLEKSRTAKKILGADFVDHYVRSRKWEVSEFERAVTDWEIRRYFEII